MARFYANENFPPAGRSRTSLLGPWRAHHPGNWQSQPARDRRASARLSHLGEPGRAHHQPKTLHSAPPGKAATRRNRRLHVQRGLHRASRSDSRCGRQHAGNDGPTPSGEPASEVKRDSPCSGGAGARRRGREIASPTRRGSRIPTGFHNPAQGCESDELPWVRVSQIPSPPQRGCIKPDAGAWTGGCNHFQGCDRWVDWTQGRPSVVGPTLG